MKSTKQNQKPLLPIIVAALLATALTSPLQAAQTQPPQTRTWTVDDNGPADFHTIQEAINAAEPGDTILVLPGTYPEHVKINKTRLTITAKNRETTIIDGENQTTPVTITADNVTIQNFTIKNADKEGPLINGGSGIVVFSNHCTIRNNKVTNTQAGIYLYQAFNNTIENNLAENNEFYNILLDYSDQNTITNNTSRHSYFGIGLDTSDNNLIQHNTVTDCTTTGIYLFTLETSNCTHNILKENTINKTTNAIQLKNAKNNIIQENLLAENKNGITLTQNSNKNTITNNKITKNQVGIQISRSQNNLIYHNNLIQNNQNAQTTLSSRNFWNNSYPSGGNYWSNYIDKDLYSGVFQNETGSDGIGDTPYTIDENNTDRYPLTEPREIRDIKVATVSPSRSQIYLGWSTNITVTIKNEGTTTVGNFTIRCKAVSGDVEIIIGTMEVAQLTPLNTTTATFQWTPENAATYRIECEVSILEGEIDFLDNTLADGTVNVRMVGDVNGDDKVDIKDLVAVIPSFGASPLHPNWNPLADLNLDNIINMRDLGLIAKNFGRIRQ